MPEKGWYYRMFKMKKEFPFAVSYHTALDNPKLYDDVGAYVNKIYDNGTGYLERFVLITGNGILRFKTEEDLMVFKIMFPDAIRST